MIDRIALLTSSALLVIACGEPLFTFDLDAVYDDRPAADATPEREPALPAVEADGGPRVESDRATGVRATGVRPLHMTYANLQALVRQPHEAQSF